MLQLHWRDHLSQIGETVFISNYKHVYKRTRFFAFCIHLDYYLSQKLEFLVCDSPYPVGQLRGDNDSIPSISLYFNHDRDPETAKANWEKRKARINRENLYIILYNLSGVTLEQLRELENVPCKNKIVLTQVPLPAVSWSLYIKPVKTHKDPYNYLEKDFWGRRYFEKKIDYIGFLNQ